MRLFFRRFAAESICSIERLPCASSKTRLFPSALKRSNVSISRTEKKIRVSATRRIGTPRSVNIQLEERERATIGREISLDGHTQARPTYTWPISQKCVKSIAETHNHPGFFLALFEIIYEAEVRKFYIPTLNKSNPDFSLERNFGYLVWENALSNIFWRDFSILHIFASNCIKAIC